MSAPRRLWALRQPLFSPRALASQGPGRQCFVPAGHPCLLGPPLPGSGSLASCLTSSPLGAQDEAPRHGLKRGRAELSPRGPAPRLMILSGWTWTLTGAAWPTLTSEAPQGARAGAPDSRRRWSQGLTAPPGGPGMPPLPSPPQGFVRTLCPLWGPGHVASGPSARRAGFLGCVRTPRGPAWDGRRAKSTRRADGPGMMDAGRRTQGRPQSRSRAAGGQAAGKARWAPPGSEGVGTGWAGGGEVNWPVDRGGAGLRSLIPGAGAAPRLWAGA